MNNATKLLMLAALTAMVVGCGGGGGDGDSPPAPPPVGDTPPPPPPAPAPGGGNPPPPAPVPGGGNPPPPAPSPGGGNPPPPSTAGLSFDIVTPPVSYVFNPLLLSPNEKVTVMPFGTSGDQLVMFMQSFVGNQLFARHIKANGDLGDTFALSGTSPLASGGVQGTPEAKCNAEGECVATWVQRLSDADTSDANTHVYARRIGKLVNSVPTLSSVSEPVVKLSANLGAQDRLAKVRAPDIAFGPQGRWVVAWDESDAGQPAASATRAARVVAARAAGSALLFKRDSVLEQTAKLREFDVRVMYQGDDIFLAALSENVNNQGALVPDGTSVSLYKLVSGELLWREGNGASNYIVGEPVGLAKTMSLASGPGGAATVVWSQTFEESGTRSAIYASHLQSNGKWSLATQVDTGAAESTDGKTGKNSSLPAVLVANDGAITIAWKQRDDKTSAIDSLYFARYKPNGSAIDIPARLVEGAAGDVGGAPTMALEFGGTFVIFAWTQRNDGGSNAAPFSVYAARLPAGGSGGELGAPVLVESDEAHATFFPSVFSGANGKVTVFWMQDDGKLFLNRSK